MISRAHSMGFLTTPYAFNPEEAAAMAKAGAHIIVAHMGLTTAGSIGAKTAVTLDDSVKRVQAIADAALGINPDVIVLCHGGTLSIFDKSMVTSLLQYRIGLILVLEYGYTPIHIRSIPTLGCYIL